MTGKSSNVGIATGISTCAQIGDWHSLGRLLEFTAEEFPDTRLESRYARRGGLFAQRMSSLRHRHGDAYAIPGRCRLPMARGGY
jgi:hypothetical protein